MLPEVTAESEEGFVDLVFGVDAAELLPDGQLSIKARGVHQGVEVGFAATIGSSWEEQQATEGFPVHWGRVRLAPRGSMSDRLVAILDALYGTGCGASRMADIGDVLAATLGDDPEAFERGPVRMKLFFREDDEDDDHYGEVYLNVDLPRHRVEFLEKDERYRRAVVMALSGLESKS